MNHCFPLWIPFLCNIPLIITKEAHPRFGLYSKTKKGFLIMSMLQSAQREPSISCHRAREHRVIFSKLLPIVRTGIFITSTPTHCCTWMYLSGSVITTGVIGLRLMIDNEARSTACRVLSGHMHTYTPPGTHTNSHNSDETLPGVSSHAGVTNENRRRVCLLYYS